MKLRFQLPLWFIFWFAVGVAILAGIAQSQAQYDLAEQTGVYNHQAFSWDNFWDYMGRYYLWFGFSSGIIGSIWTIVYQLKIK